MSVALRALIAVVLLAGFYVLAVVQLVAGLALAIWVGSFTSGAVAAKLGVAVFAATVWAVGYGTWKALRSKAAGPSGVPLDRANAPYLWATVDELARVVGTRPPDEIYLVPEVNAAVQERSRLMGLIGGRRYMYIGMPLFQAFTITQLRSVLAHELGHYSGQHTRLAVVSYRGRVALGRTISQIGVTNVAGWVFRGYARLYLMVENAVSRRQELEADLTSVRVASRAEAARALHEITVLAKAFGFYLDRYVAPGLKEGYAPDDLFGGFAQLLHARVDELARLRAEQPDEQRSLWDTHPPLGSRLAAIMAAPESPVMIDNRPAGLLVTDLTGAGRALQGEVLATERLTVLPWDQFSAAAANADLQENVDALLRSISRTVNQPVPNAGSVLDLIAAGRLDELAAPVYPQATRREARELFAEPLAALFSLAAVQSGAARWRHSWSGPIQLVGADGAELDLSGPARLATDPATVADAYHQLVARGINVTAAQHVEQRLTTRDATILAGIVNVKIAKRRTDLVLLSHGLMLVPGVARLKAGTTLRRMARWIESGNADQLTAIEGSRFIPYEEMVAARRTGKFPIKYELTLHSGEEIVLRWGGETEEVAGGTELLGRVLGRVNLPASAANGVG